jgi:hypothetical protein
MLPDDFDFAMLPTGSHKVSLSEIGMLSSTLEDIDYSMVSWLKDDLNLSARSNDGFKRVPVLWQAPERAFQIKHRRELRDDSDGIILPVVSVERTNIEKDPAKKGSYQANRYSDKRDGRAGRFVIARRIVPDKTRNFAVVNNTRRENYTSGTEQRYYPRTNNKVVIQTLSIPIPIYVSVDYKILIKTEYQQQMNDLMSPFMTRTGQINSFVMKRNGHSYEAFIQQGFTHNNNIGALGEDTREFTTEIMINVLGYLIGEGINDDRPLVRIEENAVEYQFPQESAVPAGNFNLWGEED